VSLKALGKVCRNLEAVNVSGCSKITDHGLKALSHLRSLVVINVADCVRISDPGIRHIIESPSGPSLRELNLTNCYKISDVTLLRLSQRCHKLVYACFSYCEHIFDAGIELMGHMKSLVHLDIRGCNISDEGVVGLKNNPNFRHLNLSECSEMTNIGIEVRSMLAYLLCVFHGFDCVSCTTIYLIQQILEIYLRIFSLIFTSYDMCVYSCTHAHI
jgi:F-box/leucine-rich repeat protein 13